MEGDGGAAALTIWKLAVMLQRKMALSASLGSGVAFAAVRAISGGEVVRAAGVYACWVSPASGGANIDADEHHVVRGLKGGVGLGSVVRGVAGEERGELRGVHRRSSR